MGFEAKNKVIGKIPEWQVDGGVPALSWSQHKERVKYLEDELNFLKEKDENSLTEQELMFLLHFIKEANFKGGQLEHVFQVTLKLQNQYRFLEKNE
jgi:hypothetical protein